MCRDQQKRANDGQHLKFSIAQEWEYCSHVDISAERVSEILLPTITDEYTYMKYPATLPKPSMRAAHAFASACSAEGRVSTMSARSTA